MKIKVYVSKINTDEKFSFLCNIYNIDEFFTYFFDFFDNFEDVIIRFSKIEESEQ